VVLGMAGHGHFHPTTASTGPPIEWTERAAERVGRTDGRTFPGFAFATIRTKLSQDATLRLRIP